MRNILAVMTHLLLAAVAFAATPDYPVFLKRYLPMGFEDPKGELAKALVRSDQDWEEDCKAAQECYPEAVGQLKVSTNARLQERLDVILKKLIAVSHRPQLPMRAVILESDEINACTYGGDIVYVYTGLMEAIPDDNGIAFVLAHEMAHTMARHGNRKVRAMEKAAKPLEGFETGERDLVDEIVSRIHETEADALAVNYLRKAKIKLEGYAKVMDLFQQCEPIGVSILRNQVDATSKTIEDLRKRCNTLNAQYQADGSVETYLKLVAEFEKLQTAHDEYTEANQKWYQVTVSCLRTHPEPKDRLAACRAMEKRLDGKGATAGEAIADYVFETLSKGTVRLNPLDANNLLNPRLRTVR